MDRFLIYILGISLCLNLGLTAINFSHESRFVDPDSNDYIALADNLAEFNTYAKGEEPEIFRAPGYPLFLSPFRYFFPDTVIPVIILQCLLATGSLLLLWYLALSISGGDLKIAKIAVTLQAISLSSIVYANKVLSETLFTFLLLLSFFLLDNVVTQLKTTDKQEREKPETSGDIKLYLLTLATGIICAILILVRAIFIPVFPIFLIYLWVQGAPSLRMRRSRKIYALVSIMFLPYLTALGGWSIRNSVSAGYRGFSSVGAVNIYRYYACALLAKDKGISFAEQQAICDANLAAAGTEAQQAEYSLKNGIPVLKSSPIKYLLLHLKADINNLLPSIGDFYAMLGTDIGGKGTLSVINSQGLIAGVKHYFAGNWGLFLLALPLMFILFIKYTAAATGGIYEILPAQMNITAVLYVVFIIYMITVPGTASHPRFRVPVEPLLSLFAGIGIMFAIRTSRKRFRPPSVPGRSDG